MRRVGSPSRPGVRRGRRVVRNLLAASLLLGILGGFLWGQEGYPLPTPELGLRRLERQNLLPPSEIVWTAREGECLNPQGEPEMWMDQAAAVGVRDGLALVGRARGGWTVWGTALSVFPLEEGPSPVPIPGNTLSWVKVEWDGGSPYGVPWSGRALLFLQMPEEAVRGTLEIGRKPPEESEGRCDPLECRLEPLEKGIWLAALETEEGTVVGTDQYLGAPYTLRLYGTAGDLLLEQTGIIPEEC